tara:strand:- start:1989 stop:2195 length:207 start_codon:yes stop_codon:yes gene_type:complete
MEERPFKPGDIIRCRMSMKGEFSKDGTYEVENSDGVYVNVVQDDDGDPNGWLARYFDLAEPEAAQVAA